MACKSFCDRFLLRGRGTSLLNLSRGFCSIIPDTDRQLELDEHISLLNNARKRSDIFKSKKAIIKLNKKDANLEKVARNRQLKVPLETVKKEWIIAKGLKEVFFLAKYYAIFRDIFDGEEFKPAVWMDINFTDTAVHRGNMIEPAKCLEKPTVYFASEPKKYHSLLLVNPEGCYPPSNSEVLHWMVLNIPGNKVNEGTELDFLPPMPWQGSGFQRFCFILLEQNRIIQDKSFKITDINRFEFRTRSFLSEMNAFQPVGLSWFQSQWDESVTTSARQAGIFEPKFDWLKFTDPKELQKERSREVRKNKYRIKFTVDDILL